MHATASGPVQRRASECLTAVLSQPVRILKIMRPMAGDSNAHLFDEGNGRAHQQGEVARVRAVTREAVTRQPRPRL